MQSWQEQLQHAIKTPAELLHYLGLSEYITQLSTHAHKAFATKVPVSFVKRMQKGNFQDPLLRQVLPHIAEETHHPLFISDPLEEAKYNKVLGLLHKYQGRVLVTLTGSCAINCRYCFRRHFDYASNNVGQKGWEAIFDYIAKDESLYEVILSGGDPLMMPDHMLHRFTTRLSEKKHIKILRLHTRVPIVLPDRISTTFLDWVKAQPFQLVIVVHCNHPQELDVEVKNAMQLLKNHQVTLLNQSVLLKGINDDPNILANLSIGLFSAHILPYYLHQLDKVAGTHHFAVDDRVAQEIYIKLQTLLPGYLVPKLVREIPGERNKMLI